MWKALYLFARIVGVIAGCFCVLTAALLYADEEGNIQTALEDFWVRLDDYKTLTLSRHVAFMQQVASFESKLLDWVFGHKLLSVHAIAVSACYSLASIYLTHLVAGHFIEHNHYECHKWAIAFALAFGVGTLYPFFARSTALRIVGLIGVACVLAMSIRNIFYVPKGLEVYFLKLHASIMVGGLSFAVAMDFVFVSVTRKIIRATGTMKQTANILVAIGSTFVLALVLVSPLALRFGGFPTDITLSHLMRAEQIVALSNTLDLFVACLFGFLILLLLIHRVLWPVLVRTVFRLQEVGTKGRRLILALVGVALATQSIAGRKVPEFVQELIKLLTRAA